MTVPSRAEAARLLLSLQPPAWHVRHSRAVAEVAGWLALQAARRPTAGLAIDCRLVEAAALLHDIDKALPRSTVEAGGPRRIHGRTGASWLASRGHAELAEAVSLHPVTILDDAATSGHLLEEASLEAKIVAYADKRARQRVVSMDDRFDHWQRSHPNGWDAATLATIRARAADLERQVCAAAGCEPAEVRRLRWTAPAIAAGTGS
jgi:HD superfamily phosphodiesterase